MNEIARNEISVLLVDDSPFARSVGLRVLRSVGIGAVHQASSGQEAIDLIDRLGQTVDIVFCDLMMPDMDGIQMLRRVATLAVHPAFVFLSGADAALLNAAEDTGRARGLRVLGAIQKPLTPDAVRRVLAKLGETTMAIAGGSAFEIAAQDLDIALERDEFLLHFQPKVAMADRGVAGYEALLRWRRPDTGMVFPDAFISIAERSNRIGALTERVTTLALKQSAAWLRAGMRTRISINLSAFMLVDLDLPDRMAREARRFGVNPRQLILEITESGLFRDTANALDILARLHMKGFPLSIDDFGTGYSSLEQLRHAPFTEMKIDRAFVHGAAETPKGQAILESSASLGRCLRMSVVAEGVENQEDWDAARAAGVDLVQGYFVAKPMAAEHVPAWLAGWTGRAADGPQPLFQRAADADNA
jgi:EAL domain-containing protein (putative c-di-GMP-specific phosphodiesterase class I)/AmiR/NasT family two-component response regulator